MNDAKQAEKAKLILDLTKQRIPSSILEHVAKKARSPIRRSTHRLKVYESLNYKALNVLHRAFVKCETDRAGIFLELRLAKSLMKKNKDIVKVDFRKKLIGASKVAHEVDVVGHDKDGEVIVIAESKARKAPTKKDHVIKWLKEIEDIAESDYYNKIGVAVFITLGGYTDDAIQTVKEDKRIDKKGELKIKLGFASRYYIYLYFLEERGGKIYGVFPK